MSFFKDFKADLSQAVNELLPEETQTGQDSMTEQPQMVDTITEDSPVFAQEDIANMLDNIDKQQEPDLDLIMPDLSVFDEPTPAAEPEAPAFAEPEPAPAVIEPAPVAEPEPVPVP